jgi:hypothetical protein
MRLSVVGKRQIRRLNSGGVFPFRPSGLSGAETYDHGPYLPLESGLRMLMA